MSSLGKGSSAPVRAVILNDPSVVYGSLNCFSNDSRFRGVSSATEEKESQTLAGK